MCEYAVRSVGLREWFPLPADHTNDMTYKERAAIWEQLMELTVDPKRIVKWNTGRMYGKEGQRMSAIETEHGVAFTDKDRMICGLLAKSEPVYPQSMTPENVMWLYDRNMYEQTLPWQLRQQLEAVWA